MRRNARISRHSVLYNRAFFAGHRRRNRHGSRTTKRHRPAALGPVPAQRRAAEVSLTSKPSSSASPKSSKLAEDPAVWSDPQARAGSRPRAQNARIARHHHGEARPGPARHERALHDGARRKRRRDAQDHRSRCARAGKNRRRPRIPAHVLESDGSEQLLRRHPGRPGRHRSAGLDADAGAHVSAVLRAQRISRRTARGIAGRRRRH